MRPSFLLNTELRPVSCYLPKAMDGALTVGTEVKLTCDFETDYGVIPYGTKGFVEFAEPTSGIVTLLMEGLEPALLHWQNRLMLVPFDTDDLAVCLVCGLRGLTDIQEEHGDKPVSNVTHLRTG